MSKLWGGILSYLYNVFTGGRGWRRIEKDIGSRLITVNKIRDKWAAQPPQFVIVEPFDENDKGYQMKIRDLWISREFQWLIYAIQRRALEKMMQHGPDAAGVCLGALQGIDILTVYVREIAGKLEENHDQE